MQKRKKHGYAECLKYMQMIKEGTSIHAIHMKYGINEDRLHVLWNRYQSDGRSGLFKRKNIRADFALKKEIVLDIEENHLTCTQLRSNMELAPNEYLYGYSNTERMAWQL